MAWSSPRKERDEGVPSPEAKKKWSRGALAPETYGAVMATSSNNCRRSGATLIEIMVATIILTIVLLGAAQWISTPPVMREACRQAAILKAEGILGQARASSFSNGANGYEFIATNGTFVINSNATLSIDAGSPAIPYLLTTNVWANNYAGITGMMVVIKLFEDQKAKASTQAFASFVTLAPP